jgi:ribonuclease R
MRAVMHRDRVRVRVMRHDRKGRPEGRVLDILERRKTPIIGRLLHEGGQWVVAPEDKRYGHDILIPKNATANGSVGPGGGGRTDRAAVAAFQAGRARARGAGRDRRPGHGDRDRGAQVRGAAPLLARDPGAGRGLPERLRAVDRKHRVDLRDVPLVTIDGEDARDFDDAVYCEPFKRAAARRRSAAGGCWWPLPTSATT